MKDSMGTFANKQLLRPSLLRAEGYKHEEFHKDICQNTAFEIVVEIYTVFP